jgi:hypothetical protein
MLPGRAGHAGRSALLVPGFSSRGARESAMPPCTFRVLGRAGACAAQAPQPLRPGWPAGRRSPRSPRTGSIRPPGRRDEHGNMARWQHLQGGHEGQRDGFGLLVAGLRAGRPADRVFQEGVGIRLQPRLPCCMYTARGANWAAGGRPVSRGRGVSIIDGPDSPGAGTHPAGGRATLPAVAADNTGKKENRRWERS